MALDQATPQVSVVIPALNEEQAIAGVIDEVRLALDAEGCRYEITVVDDASDDQTAEIARQKDVCLIQRVERGGSGASRKTGIRQARGEVVVMLDADGTYVAADIPSLLHKIGDWDQVNGARTSEQGTIRWLRTPVKFLIRKLACYLTGYSIPDLNTGLKAFKRRPMLRYLHLVPDGFSCVSSMTLAFMTNGHPTTYVSTGYRPRIGKSKFHPLKDTSSYILTVIRIVMYFKPLKVFLPLAALLLGIGVIKSVLDFIYVGHMQFSDVVILMTGVLVAALGLLADLVVAHGRPVFRGGDAPEG